MSVLYDSSLLDAAQNPLRSYSERHAAWEADCVLFWRAAHLDRGLPFAAVPDEFKARVLEGIPRLEAPPCSSV